MPGHGTIGNLTYAALAGLVSLFSQGAIAAEPQAKVFREWIAGCDNLGRCVARSLPDDTASFGASLILERASGATSPPVLALVLKADTLKAPPPVVTLTLDGQPLPGAERLPPAEIVDLETARIRFPAKEAEALIESARKATKIEASMLGERYEISLSGAVAALLWLDAQQGRLGTPTALIRKGITLAKTAAIPPLPVVVPVATTTLPALPRPRAKALTAALRKRIGSTEPDCEDTESLREMDSAVPIAPGETLVMILCRGGAYNYTTGFWIVPGSDTAKARKPAFQRPGKAPGNMLVNAAYDPATGQIEFLEKGRGPGDCGSMGNYAWTGRAFVLTRYAEMSQCRGLLPDDWLVLWRSEVRTAK